MAARSAVAFLVLAGSLLLLGGIGRFVVFDSRIGDAEARFLEWLVHQRTDVANPIASTGSALTGTWTVIGVLIGAVTMLLVTGRSRFAGSMLIAITLELTTFLAVGAIIDRPRPPVDVLHSVPSTPSFPSGHVAAAVVVYGSLAFVARSVDGVRRAPRTVWIAPVVAVAAVGFARLYEGVHYPTDIVAGFLLGLGALIGGVLASGAAWSDDEVQSDGVSRLSTVGDESGPGA